MFSVKPKHVIAVLIVSVGLKIISLSHPHFLEETLTLGINTIEGFIHIDETQALIDSAVMHIKEYESFRKYAYNDQSGKRTDLIKSSTMIGYGQSLYVLDKLDKQLTQRYIQNGITVEEAEYHLRESLVQAMKRARDRVDERNWYKCTAKQRLALSLFFYNCKTTGFDKTNLYVTITKYLRGKATKKQLIQAWTAWSTFKGKPHAGLKARRTWEVNLFLDG
jgi:GH24 family phage-related lysozyme (muramidase)